MHWKFSSFIDCETSPLQGQKFVIEDELLSNNSEKIVNMTRATGKDFIPGQYVGKQLVKGDSTLSNLKNVSTKLSQFSFKVTY